MRSRILAAEGGVLAVLGLAFIVTGRLLGASVLLGLVVLAVACAWAFWPADG